MKPCGSKVSRQDIAASDVVLTEGQYAALVTLAQKAAKDLVQFDEFLRGIEAKNNVCRSTLWVRWQEVNTPLPPDLDYPSQWPPTQQVRLTRYDRLVAKVDIDVELRRVARNPVSVTVTKDPAGLVGWTKLDDYF